jgi:hypothetical protein
VKQAWAKPAILLTLAGLSPGTLQCQCAPDTAAILKDLPTQIPGLPPAIVRIKGNTVEADYYIAGSNLPPDPQYGHRTRPLKISVSSYPTQQEAEHDVQMSVRLTSISPTQTPPPRSPPSTNGTPISTADSTESPPGSAHMRSQSRVPPIRRWRKPSRPWPCSLERRDDAFSLLQYGKTAPHYFSRFYSANSHVKPQK